MPDGCPADPQLFSQRIFWGELASRGVDPSIDSVDQYPKDLVRKGGLPNDFLIAHRKRKKAAVLLIDGCHLTSLLSLSFKECQALFFYEED